MRTHIAKSHGTPSPPRIWGRAKGPACALCGWIHADLDDAPREGRAIRRKRFQHGKIGSVLGIVPEPDGVYELGELTVPKGAKRIKRITISLEPCRGPFLGPPDGQERRYCDMCKRFHFDAPLTLRT